MRIWRVGCELLPWYWHIVPFLLETGWTKSTETCDLDDVFPSDDLGSGLEVQFILISICLIMDLPEVYMILVIHYITI